LGPFFYAEFISSVGSSSGDLFRILFQIPAIGLAEIEIGIKLPRLAQVMALDKTEVDVLNLE
jgi:hypothetical protein